MKSLGTQNGAKPTIVSHWGDEPRDEAANPATILDEMEKKLFDEGRKEVFAALMKDITRIKSELARDPRADRRSAGLRFVQGIHYP